MLRSGSKFYAAIVAGVLAIGGLSASASAANLSSKTVVGQVEKPAVEQVRYEHRKYKQQRHWNKNRHQARRWNYNRRHHGARYRYKRPGYGYHYGGYWYPRPWWGAGFGGFGGPTIVIRP